MAAAREEIVAEVRKADVVASDETTTPIDGRTCWQTRYTQALAFPAMSLNCVLVVLAIAFYPVGWARSATSYDKAALPLSDLKAVAEEQGAIDDFLRRLCAVRQQRGRKERLIERLAGLG